MIIRSKYHNLIIPLYLMTIYIFLSQFITYLSAWILCLSFFYALMNFFFLHTHISSALVSGLFSSLVQFLSTFVGRLKFFTFVSIVSFLIYCFSVSFMPVSISCCSGSFVVLLFYRVPTFLNKFRVIMLIIR